MNSNVAKLINKKTASKGKTKWTRLANPIIIK
jgi:hypothetical protein